MYKTIITPENDSVYIDLPKEYIGKEVEITAQLIHTSKKRNITGTAQKKVNRKASELLDFYNNYSYDVSHYKFNRDELNER